MVFLNEKARYEDEKNMINRKFNKALELAKLSKIRFHDLRHTYASILIAKEINPKYIQQQLK